MCGNSISNPIELTLYHSKIWNPNTECIFNYNRIAPIVVLGTRMYVQKDMLYFTLCRARLFFSYWNYWALQYFTVLFVAAFIFSLLCLYLKFLNHLMLVWLSDFQPYALVCHFYACILVICNPGNLFSVLYFFITASLLSLALCTFSFSALVYHCQMNVWVLWL